VEGRFLQADEVAGLREEAAAAEAHGATAVFLSAGLLGDPIVLAAGLATAVPEMLLGARISLSAEERHPAMLARDMTCLDLVCGGRSVLCFAPPFTDELVEAIALCRALWRAGELATDGPSFPVRAAANRTRPAGEGSPLVVLDLTEGDELPAELAGAVDLLLRPTADAAVCRLERT
jgi:alkanesulfonate monooxygenase SsuD/methylene tetrahydromethanopterin reductase-like flavin-dependent oxidoreductase (luciferase family)